MKQRYTTEAEIISAIDRCYANAAKLAAEAEQLDSIADHLFKYADAVEDAKGKRLQAARVRQRANNMVNKKAKKLGEKLSEFRTIAMPIIEDNSVEK